MTVHYFILGFVQKLFSVKNQTRIKSKIEHLFSSVLFKEAVITSQIKLAKVAQGEKGACEHIKILNCHVGSVFLQMAHPFCFQFNAMSIVQIHAFN